MLSHYIGELLQHDTSYHHWAPSATSKWYLITTIDDHSRKLLYGDFWEKETSWAHIVALRYIASQCGVALRYYVDNHSIFRFVERRESVWRAAPAEEAGIVQWKEVLNDLGTDVTYALSPAAKGKIERPYQWLQDHVVRTCAHEGIAHIQEAREVLYEEIHRYNYKRIHSTTQEIPALRYEKALEENRSLFRPFVLKKPFKALEDIFCYRIKRTVNPYRKILFHHLEFSISSVPIREEVELRLSLDPQTNLVTLRFWYKNQLVGQQQVKRQDLPKVHF